MSLIKWEPFGDMDRFFEDVPRFPSMKDIGWDMAVDVYDEGNNMIAEMNIPGVDGEHIDVSVEDNHLRVAAKHSEEKEEKKKQYYAREIRRGSFERVVRLPHSVDSAGVKAEYRKGVLKVILPKRIGDKDSKVKVEVKD
jgi:HSP20 family protein